MGGKSMITYRGRIDGSFVNASVRTSVKTPLNTAGIKQYSTTQVPVQSIKAERAPTPIPRIINQLLGSGFTWIQVAIDEFTISIQ